LFDPARNKLSFDYPNIRNLTHPYFYQLDDELIRNLISLSLRLNQWFQRNENAERYMFAFPDLYENAFLWVHEVRKSYPEITHKVGSGGYYLKIFANDMDERLKRYLHVIYTQNYTMHVCGIGGKSRTLADCGIEQDGINHFWNESISAIRKARKEFKTVSVHNYFWPLYTLIVWFFGPALYSRYSSDRQSSPKKGGGFMLRTFIQVLGLSLVLLSSFFLIKGVLASSSKDLAALSGTYWGYNPVMMKNLAQQKADTLIGFILLLGSFLCQTIHLLWPLRIGDFKVDPKGVSLGVVSTIVILVGCLVAANFCTKRIAADIANNLQERQNAKADK